MQRRTTSIALALLVAVAILLPACSGGTAGEPAAEAAPTAIAAGLPSPMVQLVTRSATVPVASGAATATTTPKPTATPAPSPAPLGPQSINGIALDDIVAMPPEVAANVRAIYARGQELGRDPHAFSKLGDSTILNPHFLGPFDEGAYTLGEWDYLQPTIDWYKGSFERHGVAAHFGQHSWTVFDPMWADKEWCEPNEDALACEFRLQNPSVLFVRLGSNDAGSPSGFRYNLAQVIETSIAQGVIPIIGTKADRFEGSNENNDILRELAAEYDVPLWDFDLVAGTIPNRGLGDDAIHLKIEDIPHDYTQPEALQRGHALQDLTALVMLDRVRRVVGP